MYFFQTPLPQHYFTTPNGLIHHPAAAAAAAGPWAAGAYLPNGAFATQGPFGAAAAAAQGQTIMATQGTGAGGATPGGQGGGQDAAAAAAALAAGGLAGAGMFTTPSYKPGGGRGSYQVRHKVHNFSIAEGFCPDRLWGGYRFHSRGCALRTGSWTDTYPL